MGRMLEALKQIENQTGPSRSVKRNVIENDAPVEAVVLPETVEMDEPPAVEHPEPVAAEEPHPSAPVAAEEPHPSVPLAAEEPHPSAPLDPRYREVLGMILAQVAARGHTVLLVAGFADEESSGGQLAELYAKLAGQIEDGVLVVDADLANASLAERLGADAEHGPTKLLEIHADWTNAVRETRYPGLYLMPGRKCPGLPSDVDHKPISGNRLAAPFAALVSELRETHRLVLVDALFSTPQEMGSWAAMCDAALVVARLEITPRKQIRQAIRQIRARGAGVLGCILLDP
ncbi:MAG: hypothetical protein JW719_08285 [Pirellulales bacterium]|nr:hypothetical protein [Pirellulales bacterium]